VYRPEPENANRSPASFTNAWFMSMIPLSRGSRRRIAKFPAPSARARRITARDFLKMEFASKQLPEVQKPANSIT